MEEKQIERRQTHRKHVAYFSRVFDVISGDQLGNLGDITTSGLMLISANAVEVPKTYKIRIELSSDVAGKGSLEILATSLWSRADIDPSRHNTGFKISKISTEDKAIIHRIISRYSIRNN